MTDALPQGEPVVVPDDIESPKRGEYKGHFVSLLPLGAASHVADLFACSHGSPEIESLWTYLPYGPFSGEAEMEDWLRECESSTDPLFFTAVTNPDRSPAGMVSFLNIVPDSLRLELGHIWYGSSAQRTNANTEAAYLMLSEAFDVLGYRRVEWKCDSLNARSRSAALRLGFKYEGIFRQHTIRKGRNWDTAWYSMLDKEWSTAKANVKRWLYENTDGKLSLSALNGVGEQH